MKKQIRINYLYSWSGIHAKVLSLVGSYNVDNGTTDLETLRDFVNHYKSLLFDYTAKLDGHTLSIYADGVLIIALAEIEIYELQPVKYY